MIGAADSVLIREVSVTRSVLYREVPLYLQYNVVRPIISIAQTAAVAIHTDSAKRAVEWMEMLNNHCYERSFIL